MCGNVGADRCRCLKCNNLVREQLEQKDKTHTYIETNTHAHLQQAQVGGGQSEGTIHSTYNFHTFISLGSRGPEHHICNIIV